MTVNDKDLVAAPIQVKNDIAAKEERKEFYDPLRTTEELVGFFKNKKA